MNRYLHRVALEAAHGFRAPLPEALELGKPSALAVDLVSRQLGIG